MISNIVVITLDKLSCVIRKQERERWVEEQFMPKLDKHAAGALIRKRREERGLTQENVVDNTTVPNAGYLSKIESGGINPARTKHLLSIAEFVGLSEDDLIKIMPMAAFSAPESSEKKEDRAIPPALLDAIDMFGDKYPELKTREWQQFLVGFRSRNPKEKTPPTG